MSYFQGADGAKVFERGVPFQADSAYTVKIKAIKVVTSQKDGRLFYCVETEVETSNNEKDPVGATRSWLVNMTDRKMAYSNILGFLLPLLGVSRSDKAKVEAIEQRAQAVMDKSIENDGAGYVGKRLALSTRLKKTRKGGDFTEHNWDIPA